MNWMMKRRPGHCLGSPESRNMFLSPPHLHPPLQDLRSLRQDTQNQGARPEAKDAKHWGQGRVEESSTQDR